jgi:ankyrin repeat protein
MELDIKPERVNELDEDGRPPIVAAAYNDDHDLIQALLRAGADIDAKSQSGRSALFTAVVYGQTDTARILISSGADLSEKDETLLAAVAFRSPLESIRLLLQSGANPNYVKHPPRAISGQPPLTPLQQAAAFGTLEAVKLLVENGADIAITPHALVSAVFRGRIETAQYLISQGADPNVLDPEGNSLLFVALDTPTAMLRYPETLDVDPWDHQLRLIQVLIENGADLNLRNRDGETLMQAAVRDHNRGLVRFIREHSA